MNNIEMPHALVSQRICPGFFVHKPWKSHDAHWRSRSLPRAAIKQKVKVAASFFLISEIHMSHNTYHMSHHISNDVESYHFIKRIKNVESNHVMSFHFKSYNLPILSSIMSHMSRATWISQIMSRPIVVPNATLSNPLPITVKESVKNLSAHSWLTNDSNYGTWQQSSMASPHHSSQNRGQPGNNECS